MWQFLLVLAAGSLASAQDLPPSCNRTVYCDSKILHHVQLARVFNDSKTFVDLAMNYDENKTLTDFDQLLLQTNDTPTVEQLRQFVEEYFTSEGELEEWIPTDFNANANFDFVKDAALRKFAEEINSIWPIISRKVKAEVFEKPEQFSLIPLKNGFIIPGGRFKEIYYWDTFWIIEGLLVSGMKETAKGVIENLIDLLNSLGHIPNGSRWYYQERSQPPLLSDMVAVYYKHTQDIDFLRDNIASLEKEVEYWLDSQIVTIEKDNHTYNLLRYYAQSAGPRPESYREDYEDAQKLNESDRSTFYINIKSAAESGWDFSARWFIGEDGSNNGSLTDIQTRYIIPVDLNAIFCGILENVADFHTILGNVQAAIDYRVLATQWRAAIQAVHWNDEEGVWFDYDIYNQVHRKYFYPTNLSPLWQGVVDQALIRLNGDKIVNYVKKTGALDFPGGVPTSLDRSGEQWDFPNVWPPQVAIVVHALEAINTNESKKLALDVATTYVRACRKGYEQYEQMFEKYDAENPGEYGFGGEYVVQIGFGWSNGAVLEFLEMYGDVMTAGDSDTGPIKDLPPSCNRTVYCDSKILHHVQLARVFNDSKTFVDLAMNYDENKTLTDFDQLLLQTNDAPTIEQLRQFVEEYFTSEGELEEWIPTDFNANANFDFVKDANLRKFAEDINSIWPIISRKVKAEVFEKPEQFSLIPLKNGFIIPGGRFKEIYYWDTFWIIEGLLVSGMKETAKGVIENLIDLLNSLGHIPNGSRWYYQERSQPPLLSDMVAVYYKHTQDIDFLRDNIASLEKEVEYWLDSQIVTIEKDNHTYNLLRYYAQSAGPRPESYREDYEDAQKLNESDRSTFYINIKSAAESGWDFSARWFIGEDGSNNGSLTDIQTRYIIPVDLNAIFCGILENVADFHTILGNIQAAINYRVLATQWRAAIQAVHWNDEEGVWFDYDIYNQVHRKYFYPTNLSPLWQGVVDQAFIRLNGDKIVNYVNKTGALDFPGGVPTSLDRSGEQWDFPNVWPPQVAIVVHALEAINTIESKKLALDVATTYVRACRKGYEQYEQMFEKYDAENPGEYGFGGEYVVQIGFGWSNGAVLEFLEMYGDVMTADDSNTGSIKAVSSIVTLIVFLNVFKMLF